MSGLIALTLFISCTLLMACLRAGPFAKTPFNRYADKLAALSPAAQLIIKRLCQLVIALGLLYFFGLIK